MEVRTLAPGPQQQGYTRSVTSGQRKGLLGAGWGVAYARYTEGPKNDD